MNDARVYLIHYEEKLRRKRQRASVRELSKAMEMPEEEFLENFKIGKDMVHYLCEELEEDLAPCTADGLPVLIKVLASLKVLINGHYQRGIGKNQNLSLGQTTVSKFLNQFVGAVNRKYPMQSIEIEDNEINAITENNSVSNMRMLELANTKRDEIVSTYFS
ncbi:unnamed protein product [Diatraea saccharalis]|uniref:Uncharacterized protein n=1 Tax=Diatraea saccharalis TaxID=40085 RepID=A0A9N9WH18_9NEOP|nr:unnamed protein product [Diatraea saccharalis]